MELTGKCKVDFEKWWKPIGIKNAIGHQTLYSLPQSMIYGVFVDYFDSVGIILDPQPVIDYDNDKYIKVLYYIQHVLKLGTTDEDFNENEYKTRQEARTEAIKKATEIYNSK